MHQFTLKQLLLSVTMISVGLGLGAFATRPDTVPNTAPFDDWHSMDRFARLTGGAWSLSLLIGGLMCVVSGGQTKGIMRMLSFALLIGFFLGLMNYLLEYAAALPHSTQLLISKCALVLAISLPVLLLGYLLFQRRRRKESPDSE